MRNEVDGLLRVKGLMTRENTEVRETVPFPLGQRATDLRISREFRFWFIVEETLREGPEGDTRVSAVLQKDGLVLVLDDIP